MRTTAIVAAIVLAGAAALAGFVWSGAYPIGADEPHWGVTSEVLELLRERSVAAHARGVQVPADLGASDRVRRGAGNYDAMCTGCHLKPGMDDSEIRKGLYPQPPDLARDAAGDPGRQFWVIKHGIKMTGMPAWSSSGMDDDTIWDMVALLQKLPALQPQEYAALVEASEGHVHSGATGGGNHVDPPGTPPHGHGD